MTRPPRTNFTALVLGGPARAAARLALALGLQAAAALCVGEALKLCPGALQMKGHGLACLRT